MEGYVLADYILGQEEDALRRTTCTNRQASPEFQDRLEQLGYLHTLPHNQYTNPHSSMPPDSCHSYETLHLPRVLLGDQEAQQAFTHFQEQATQFYLREG